MTEAKKLALHNREQAKRLHTLRYAWPGKQ